MTQVKPVAILGCGPAGLLAAHAANLLGHTPVVFSIKEKSVMPGAQYLHDPIPQLCSEEPDGVISYQKVGTQQGYAAKVYGSPDAPCSWAKFAEGEQPCWSISGMYDKLWEQYERDVVDRQVSRIFLHETLSDFPMVISSIPLHFLCRNPLHSFSSKKIYIADKCSAPLPHGNVIQYNGDPQWDWYRTSRIFGHEATESTVPITGFGSERDWPKNRVGHKPTSHNCDCWPEIVKVGRFGKWERGVLVHHAFSDALNAIEEKFGRTQHAML